MYFTFPLVWVMIMMAFSVYDGRKNIRIVDEFANLTLASLLAGVTLAGVLYMTFRETSRVTFLVFFFATYILLVFWRVVVRLLYRRRNEMEGLNTRVLIIGAGPVGRDIEIRIKEHSHLDVTLCGFLDDDYQKRENHSEILGNLDEFVRSSKNVIPPMWSLPSQPAHMRKSTAWSRNWTNYRCISGSSRTISAYPCITPKCMISRHPHARLRAAALTEYQRMVKRSFDLIITTRILVFALPVMGIVALLIRLTDGKPILFTQQRVGENGRLFKIYKFRTMVMNEEAFRNRWKRWTARGIDP